MLNYIELKESIIELFERVKGRDYDGSCIKSIGRCFYEYEMTMNEGLTEYIICPLLIAQVALNSCSRVFVGQYKLFETVAKEAIEKESELDLTDEERVEVVDWAKQLLEKLPNLEIEHDPKAK